MSRYPCSHIKTRILTLLLILVFIFLKGKIYLDDCNIEDFSEVSLHSSVKDSRLIQCIKKKYIYPPSSQPYNLQEYADTKESAKYNLIYKNTVSYNNNKVLIRKLFSQAPPGFFIEAGAMDGEFISNTLLLEKKYNWTGLLVEPDSRLFTLLQRKHRKAWSSPVCLSTKPYPHKATLAIAEDSGFNTGLTYRGLNALTSVNSINRRLGMGRIVYEACQCIPIYYLLYAMNVNKVDFFSLDVEDSEMGILESFPFDKIDVTVWLVEHNFSGDKKDVMLSLYDAQFVKWMESKGYELLNKLDADYLFVKRSSSFFQTAKKALSYKVLIQ